VISQHSTSPKIQLTRCSNDGCESDNSADQILELHDAGFKGRSGILELFPLAR